MYCLFIYQENLESVEFQMGFEGAVFMSENILERVLTRELARQIDGILSNYQYDASRLIGILLDIQQIIPKQYIPEEIAYYLAQKLNMKITNIYDCITFYGSIYSKARAEYPLQICNSIVCKVKKGERLAMDLKKILKVEIGQATADGKFIIEMVPCFGACDVAPAIKVNGKIYGNLNNEEKIKAMLQELV